MFAGDPLQGNDSSVHGSKWKVVSDKTGEGKGGLAALLLRMNKRDTGSANTALPALV